MEIKQLSLSQQLKMLKGATGIQEQTATPGVSGVQDTKRPGFTDFLQKSFSEVNDLGLEADRSIQRALEGKEANPHNTMIALQKADVSFRLLLSVQQRLVQAYQQIIRTPIG